jgi:MFS transporter, DHA2 family, methylenomycin A resistance protein
MQPSSLRLRAWPDMSERSAVRARLATSLTLAAMSLGYGVVQLDVTIVNTALSVIGNSLGGGVAELQWVVSAYTIAFAAFILTAGALGDRIAIFTAASLACRLAGDALTLIVARAVRWCCNWWRSAAVLACSFRR